MKETLLAHIIYPPKLFDVTHARTHALRETLRGHSHPSYTNPFPQLLLRNCNFWYFRQIVCDIPYFYF